MTIDKNSNRALKRIEGYQSGRKPGNTQALLGALCIHLSMEKNISGRYVLVIPYSYIRQWQVHSGQ